MKRILEILIVLILLSGCGHRYKIDREKIKLSYKIDHGFTIYQLTVNKLGINNFPVEYEKKEIAFCVPNKNPGRERIEKNLPSNTLEIYDRWWEKQKIIHDSLAKLEPENRIIKSTDKNESARISFNAIHVRDSIINEHFSFEPADIIYFKRKNESFWWRTENYLNPDLEILPVDFEEGIWYKIKFSNQSCYTDDFYFRFNDEGQVITNHIEGYCGAPW